MSRMLNHVTCIIWTVWLYYNTIHGNEDKATNRYIHNSICTIRRGTRMRKKKFMTKRIKWKWGLLCAVLCKNWSCKSFQFCYWNLEKVNSLRFISVLFIYLHIHIWILLLLLKVIALVFAGLPPLPLLSFITFLSCVYCDIFEKHMVIKTETSFKSMVTIFKCVQLFTLLLLLMFCGYLWHMFR